MQMVVVLWSSAMWLLCLLSLALHLSGRPWPATSRHGSAGGLIMCTGILIEVLLGWPLVMLLLAAAGAVYTLIGHARTARFKLDS